MATCFIGCLLYNPEGIFLLPYPLTTPLTRIQYGRPNHENEDRNAFPTSNIPPVLLTTFLLLARGQVNFYWTGRFRPLYAWEGKVTYRNSGVPVKYDWAYFFPGWTYSIGNKHVIISFSNFLFCTCNITNPCSCWSSLLPHPTYNKCLRFPVRVV